MRPLEPVRSPVEASRTREVTNEEVSTVLEVTNEEVSTVLEVTLGHC